MIPKLISAGQNYPINNYKNIKGKLLKCNSNIYFNRQCISKIIIPKFYHAKIPNSLPGAKFKIFKAKKKKRIKDKLKFLYTKNKKLKERLYSIQLKLTREWTNAWYIINT
jgi:hypothetical protein